MLKLLIATVFAACAFGAVVNNGSEAATLVMETMLTDLSNKEVRSLDYLLPQGEIMGEWSLPGKIVPFDSYLVLIDDYAYANWAHPCRWVFVSPEGQTEVIRAAIPPDVLPRMMVEYTCLPATDDGKGQYEDFLAWFTPNVQSTSGNAEHMYAWIISGGANQGNNHIRYYGDVQFIYNVLAHDYLLPDDHIIVCFADGLNPAPDQSGGINSNPDFDDDGDSDIIYDATTAGVTNGYNDIAGMVGADDHLFVFTTDHGNSGKGGFDNPPEVILNLWNATLDDDTMEGWLDAMTAMSIHVVMEQCFSGGFLEEVIHTGVAQPRTFASAANAYESSWAGATYPQYDEYVYYWTGAVHGSIPPSSGPGPGPLPGDPDMNGDGCVSMYEAYTKATEWDTYAQTGQEHPQWDDTPDSCGDDYYLGGLIQTSVGDYNHGLPMVGFTLVQNPIVSTAMVNFTLPSTSQATIEVLDIAGRILSTPVAGNLEQGSHTVSANLENAPAGIYVIRLTTPAGSETLRAVKL